MSRFFNHIILLISIVLIFPGIAQAMPQNAHSVATGWKCNTGFKRQGQQCNPIYIPPNATLKGNGWVCKPNFKRRGRQCNRIANAAHNQIRAKPSINVRKKANETSKTIVDRVKEAERRENLKTCISGEYPSLCKHHMLSKDEVAKTKSAERRQNRITCLSGKYPSLCKRNLLTKSEALKTSTAEKRDNLTTCLSGMYPSLCKKNLLSGTQRQTVVNAEKRENLKTCLSGQYPSLCKKNQLTAGEAKKVDEAEKRENLKICLSGKYPSLCNKDLLVSTSKQAVNSIKIETPSKATQSQDTSAVPLRSIGSRSYDYNVSGYKDDGSYIYGDVNVTSSGGDGYVYKDNGESVYVTVDWVGKGMLEGYDDNGEYYEFEVD